MYRPAARVILRSSQSSLAPPRTLLASPASARRFISTEPPHLRGRSWKNAAIRWGIAIAGIWYYNTSPVFAEQPQHNLLNPNLDALDEEQSPSLDVLAARRKNKNAQTLHSAANSLSSENASVSVSNQSLTPETIGGPPPPGSVQDLEEEAEGEGAFNPETGEINWDCPCLGGMAHGPCGPEFREAFSCFVFSKDEPKGMDCIERFQGMRDCFQRHPDVYKDELMDDEELDRELAEEKEELTKQIAERRKQEQAAEGQGQSQRRLLEEPAPEPRVKATKKIHEKLEEEGRATAEAAHNLKEDAKVKVGAISETAHNLKEDAKAKVGAAAEAASNLKEDVKSKAGDAAKTAHSLKEDAKARLPSEKEHINEGQTSQTIRRPNPPPVQEAADPVDDLIPKAAHDARDAKA